MQSSKLKYYRAMEKPHQKGSRTKQIRYPAPYSQSWTGSIGHKKKILVKTPCSAIISPKKRLPRKPQSAYHGGLTVTVPRLKYGLFEEKMCIGRGHSQTLSTKQSTSHSNSQVGRRDADAKNWWNDMSMRGAAISRTSTVHKYMNPKLHGEPAYVPVVYRPHKQVTLRTLSISESTHLDIRPSTPRSYLCKRPL